MSTNDSLRAADSDREQVAERLRQAAAEGRLDQEELEARLEAALTARTYGELDRLVADLPPREPEPAPRRTRSRRRPKLGFAGVAAIVMAIWALTGAGYFWPAWVLLGLAFWGPWHPFGSSWGCCATRHRRAEPVRPL